MFCFSEDSNISQDPKDRYSSLRHIAEKLREQVEATVQIFPKFKSVLDDLVERVFTTKVTLNV